MSGFLLNMNIPSELAKPCVAPQVGQWLADVAYDLGTLAGSRMPWEDYSFSNGVIAATALDHNLTVGDAQRRGLRRIERETLQFLERLSPYREIPE